MTAAAVSAVLDGIALTACANCGAAGALRFRIPYRVRDEAGVAQPWYQVACGGCEARAPFALPSKAEAALLWNRAPPSLPAPRPRDVMAELASAPPAAPGRQLEGDLLELLARLLVASSYKVPVEGRGTKPGMQAADIAGALGMMSDPLRREVAVAVAQREPAMRSAPRIVRLAYERIAYVIQMRRPAPLDLQKPEDCHRLRLVIYDAATELVWPEKKQPAGVLAKAAKMRKVNYLRAHRVATAELQAVLNEGRREFGARLFSLWCSEER